MNSLPEQFSAARQAQLDNGFNLMRSLSDQALDRTSRVFALQLDASRAAVEQTSSAMRQLLAARDPRDLLALGSQSQAHLRTMLDYGRELFSVATASLSVPVLRSQAAACAPAALVAAPQHAAPGATEQAASEAFERIGADTASAAAAAAESLAETAAAPLALAATPETAPVEKAAAAPAQAPADRQPAAAAGFALPSEAAPEAAGIEVVTSDVEPDAAPKAIAKATSEALDMPVAPPHPIAASVPVEVAVEIELPKVEPVDATPPAAASAGGRPAEARGSKGRRKQN